MSILVDNTFIELLRSNLQHLGKSKNSLNSPGHESREMRTCNIIRSQRGLENSLLPHDLVIWTDGSVSSLFLLAKAALVYLPTAIFVALRPHFPFRQAQYAQVFPLKPAPFCKLLVNFGSTNKSATPLLFLSDSRHLVFSSVFSFTSIFLADLAGTVFLLFYHTTMGPRILVLPRNYAADELARGAALLMPSAIPCGLYTLISRIHSYRFSNWKRTVSSKFFDTQVSSVFTEELGFPCHAHCALSCLRCNEHSLMLSSYLSRIGRVRIVLAVPADTRHRTHLISF